MNHNKLIELFEKQNLTQAKFAKKAGISTNTLQYVLSGNNTTIDTMEAISAALGVSMHTWWDADPVSNSDSDNGIKRRLKDVENENRDLRNHLQDKDKIISLLEKQLALYEGKKQSSPLKIAYTNPLPPLHVEDKLGCKLIFQSCRNPELT